MTDEPTGHPDQDELDQDDSGSQAQDQPQDGQPQGVGDEPVPLRERFKGKSEDEMLDAIEEKERFIGKQSTEITDLKSRIESLEASQVSGGAQDEPEFGEDPFTFMPPQRPGFGGYNPNVAAPGPVSGPTGETPEDSFDYEHAGKSTRKIATDVVRQEIAALQFGNFQREFSNNINRAKSAFRTGSQSAMGRNKRLFGGIEKEVQKRVYEYYYPFVMQGQSVDDILRTDEPWVKTAQSIRLERKQFDKLMPEKPMSATKTEHPDSAQPGPKGPPKRMTDVDWNSESVRQFMKAHDLTRKEAEEIIAGMQEDVETGKLRTKVI